MIKEIIKTAFILAGLGLLAGCIHKPQIMDGPGMMYDFASYELNGQWTEILTDTPWKLSFADDQMTCTDGEGNETVSAYQYQLDSSTDSGTLTFENTDLVFSELLYRRQVYKYQPVRLLFETEGTSVTRIFAKNEDIKYIPEDYVPTPFETAKTPETDPAVLDDAFLHDILFGKWIRIGSIYQEDPEPQQITFDPERSVWLLEDGSERHIPYSVSAGTGNLSRDLSIDSWASEDMYPSYSEMRYQAKVISGETVRMLFGLIPIDGGSDPYAIGNIFVREEDLPLIPQDYHPDLTSDNAKDPVTVRKSHFAGDLLDTMQWLGKTKEETGIPADCFEGGNARIDGYLMSESTYGFAVFSDVCEHIYIYCSTMDLETCRKQLAERYGEAEQYELPYWGGVGMTEGWIFRKDQYQIDLHQGSEQDHITIELTASEEKQS